MDNALHIAIQSVLAAGWTVYVVALFLRAVGNQTRTDP